MMLGRTFLVGAALALLTGLAAAAPVVADPNFNQTPTVPPYYYGVAGWGAAGLPVGDPAYNPSFAGNVGFDVYNQWNNGTPGNGQTKVGFLSNKGGYIFQTITGLTLGESYDFSVLANGRVASLGYPLSSPAALTITAGAFNTTLYSAVVTPVDPASVQDTLFHLVTTLPFTAYATAVTVELTNTGAQDSSVLLSGFAINDLGIPVPEPVSMAVLGAGLFGFALVRRR